MAEIATIARPYAEAFYQALRGQQAAVAGADDWLAAAAVVAADAQVQQVAQHPKATADQVFGLVLGVLNAKGFLLSDLALNFLRTVVENDRLSALPEIAVQVRTLINAQSGTSDALVQSAFPLNDAALSDLGAVLERRFGRRLNLSVALAPELIGGVRVVVGDEVLDTSVKARLEQMKVALTA